MGRPPARDSIEPQVRDYCERASTASPEEMPLSFLGMSRRLKINRATLKKYFSDLILESQRKQKAHPNSTARQRRRREFADIVSGKDKTITEMEHRNKALLARLALVEINAARLGINPEELYAPVPKPDRRVSRAGRGGKLSRSIRE